MKIALVLLIITFAIATLMQVEVNAAEELTSSSPLAERNNNSKSIIRRKRGWFWDHVVPAVSVIVPVGVQVGISAGKLVVKGTVTVVNAVGNMCRRSLALTNTRAPGDDIDFNLQIIDSFINRNFEDNNPLKVIMEREHPELNGTLQFSKRGFECNNEFCHKHGHGVYAFGICSPYSCSCSSTGSESKICMKPLIFDPMYETCDDPTRIHICGF